MASAESQGAHYSGGKHNDDELTITKKSILRLVMIILID